MSIYQDILNSISTDRKLLAVLIDPDKINIEKVPPFIEKINLSIATHIFVGGSTVVEGQTEAIVVQIKKHTALPIILFPGDITQITNKADGILFLSLISGRNPDYLIGKHVEAVPILRQTTLEVIPTGYLLIESGTQTAVERVSKTQPLGRNDLETIINTSKAGELSGTQLIYLEAGSGAMHPVNPKIISSVKQELNVPLIVGGGIRSISQLEKAYESGADLVVIGTALEHDDSFFETIHKSYERIH